MTDAERVLTLLTSIETMSTAFKTALDTRTAPNSLLFEGKTLQQVKDEFDAATATALATANQYTDTQLTNVDAATLGGQAPTYYAATTEVNSMYDRLSASFEALAAQVDGSGSLFAGKLVVGDSGASTVGYVPNAYGEFIPKATFSDGVGSIGYLTFTATELELELVGGTYPDVLKVVIDDVDYLFADATSIIDGTTRTLAWTITSAEVPAVGSLIMVKMAQ